VLGQDPGQLQDDQPEVQVTKPLFFVTDEEAKQDKAFGPRKDFPAWSNICE
jgi:hypothetical protein